MYLFTWVISYNHMVYLFTIKPDVLCSLITLLTTSLIKLVPLFISGSSHLIHSGYMSPEYAMDGLFSEKSDVFSFGVIILEIISGKKNIAFFDVDQSQNLLGRAWNLWKDGNGMGLMDSALHASCSSNEVMRYIQIGLLCVQERAIDRPNMSDVIFMLSNESIALPYPKEPAFLSQFSSDADSSSSRQRYYSKNDMTMSEVDAR
ncbi:receptor-like serine/threonine-protein kinase SD1-8 isoform X4 [Rosa rugosa]|uniref:receptor-like serine/threonine-protein kinase SD1-8 isoform X4 n=1 Tax=Rosa rugosa TaxID=74645 RepID=UPI002B40F7FE|nr:receptor-like serine/threonine-protein kinase SD1-8 isoform X4 [Rosa rugosa]